MRPSFLWAVLLALALAGVTQISPRVARSAPQATDPVVHAVLFYSDLCSHCHYVMANVLPPLQGRYGARLAIRLIEVSAPQNRARLRQAGAALGLAADAIGVPLLVIGERGLVGAVEIENELPTLIETHLAAGGVAYPTLPGVAEPAAASSPNPAPTPGPAAEAAPRSNGFALAIAILLGMAAALVYTAFAITRGVRGAHVALLPPRFDIVLPVVAVLGLAVAGYLTYVETTSVRAICGPVGDCNAVQSSPYARLLGVVPVGVVGALGYIGILGVWLWQRFRSDWLAVYAPLILFGMALFGVIFSLYLTYLEPFVIGAVCAWCLTSAVLITATLLLTVGPLVRAMAPPAEVAGAEEASPL
ncbi:MAG: vitamin K epoxide reductase family protein [Anaerolineae bacterium]